MSHHYFVAFVGTGGAFGNTDVELLYPIEMLSDVVCVQNMLNDKVLRSAPVVVINYQELPGMMPGSRPGRSDG